MCSGLRGPALRALTISFSKSLCRAVPCPPGAVSAAESDTMGRRRPGSSVRRCISSRSVSCGRKPNNSCKGSWHSFPLPSAGRPAESRGPDQRKQMMNYKVPRALNEQVRPAEGSSCYTAIPELCCDGPGFQRIPRPPSLAGAGVKEKFHGSRSGSEAGGCAGTLCSTNEGSPMRAFFPTSESRGEKIPHKGGLAVLHLSSQNFFTLGEGRKDPRGCLRAGATTQARPSIQPFSRRRL